jgi:hypothetical protein
VSRGTPAKARRQHAVAMPAEDFQAEIGHGRWTRAGVKAYLARRYSTRLHMSAILAASGLVAMLASSIMLSFGVTSMLVRYPIGIVLSYLTFLAGIFAWLRLMGLRTNSGARTDLADAADAADLSWGGPTGGGGGGGSGMSLPRGGGGLFDGGGANASFAHAEARMPMISASLRQGNAGPGSDSASGLKGIGIDLGDAFDGEAIVLLLLAALLVLVVFATSGYLIWVGPDILAEAAFGALLAGGLARRTRQETAAGWIAGVVKKTWWPFAVVLAAAIVFAAYAAKHFPGAHSFRQCLAIVFG